VVSVATVVATDVNADGHRAVLGLEVFMAEDGRAGWPSCGDWSLRGAVLVVFDAHAGLKNAVAAVLPGAGWQRSSVHYPPDGVVVSPASLRRDGPVGGGLVIGHWETVMFAGIDWGGHRHQLAVVDDLGEVVTNRPFPHDRADLDELVSELDRYGGADVPVAIERSDGMLANGCSPPATWCSWSDRKSQLEPGSATRQWSAKTTASTRSS